MTARKYDITRPHKAILGHINFHVNSNVATHSHGRENQYQYHTRRFKAKKAKKGTPPPPTPFTYQRTEVVGCIQTLVKILEEIGRASCRERV